MSRKDYIALADILGDARIIAGDEGWKLIYNAVYIPLVQWLEADNPRFNATRFAYAVAQRANTKLPAEPS